MEPPNSVNVLEVCKIAPTLTSQAAAPTTLPLTFFDAMWLRFPPTQRLFFYEFPPHATTPAAFFDAVIPKLKQSLSVTLQYFLPLAGNLIWPPDYDKPIIRYIEGDAASLTIAESQADFQSLSSNSFRRSIELHPLLPPLPSTDTQAPAIGLQVTLFPNVGFCIGIPGHHAVLDGKSTATFMHLWSSICCRGNSGGDSTDHLEAPPPELTPFYDRTVVKDPDDIARKYLNFYLEENGPNNRSLKIWDSKAPPEAMLGTFHLTPTDIQKLKKSVLEEWGKENYQKPDVHLSTFTVTTAYVWACLIKAQKVKAEKVYLVLTVDCRPRLEPPLPSNYFGNCVTGYFVQEMKLNDLVAEGGVVLAAKAIGEAIRDLNNGVLEEAKDLLDKFYSIPRERILTIAGSPRLGLYSTDFGWGKPKKSEVVSIDKTGALSLSDTRDGINGGVDIGVVLKMHEIDEFASLFAGGLEAL